MALCKLFDIRGRQILISNNVDNALLDAALEAAMTESPITIRTMVRVEDGPEERAFVVRPSFAKDLVDAYKTLSNVDL